MKTELPDGLPLWEEPYPDPELLRLDICAMESAIVNALFSVFPTDGVLGVYAKGSTVKTWDSPVDYVPEISDLDIHVRISGECAENNPLSAISEYITFQRIMESEFRMKRPNPIHLPRPQVIFLNYLASIPNYVPSPRKTVKTLYGEPYDDKTDITGERYKKTILDTAYELQKNLHLTSQRFFDKFGKYNFSAIRSISYRISPSGPMLLILGGIPFKDAWEKTEHNPLGA